MSKRKAPDIDVVNPRLPERTSLCVLWNVVLRPETLWRAWHCEDRRSVKDVLRLEGDWPVDLLEASYESVRFVGVPLKPGICPEMRCYDCLGIALVVIRSRRPLQRVSYCQKSRTFSQKECCKSLVLCVGEVQRTALHFIPRKDAVSLWDIFRINHTSFLLKALADAASEHESYVRDFCVRKEITFKVIQK